MDERAPKFTPDPTLYPFPSNRMAMSNGAVIHYLDEGEGPVLLLLHGNPAWSFLYRKIIPGLRGRFRCIAPDYPGFGLSTALVEYGFTASEHATMMSEFVERLDLADMTIMMQDWGGPIGFAVALDHPDRVRAFVIGNTFAWPLMGFGQKVFSILMGGWPGQLMAWANNGVVRFFFSRGVVSKLTKPELDMYLGPFRERKSRRPTHIFPRQLRAADKLLTRVEKGLVALQDRPALILWGERDFAFKDAERRRFRAAFPNHREIILHDAGHFIQEDAPNAICAAVVAWHDDLEKENSAPSVPLHRTHERLEK